MEYDQSLAAVGKNIPRAALAQQGKVSLGLARAEAVTLASFGWVESCTSAIEQHINTLEQRVALQSLAREDARLAAAELRVEVTLARTFLRKMRAALPSVLRALPQGDTTRTMFKAGVPLAASVPNMSTYLSQIRPGIEKLNDRLSPFFQGQSPLATLDTIRTKLDEASTKAALTRRKIPEATLAVNESKGRLLQKLKDLQQTARVAFDSQPERLAKFALGKIVRAKGESPSPAPNPSPPGATPAAAAPTATGQNLSSVHATAAAPQFTEPVPVAENASAHVVGGAS